MKTFSELGLSDALLRAIAEQGYETPMPIQEEVIPWLTEAVVDNQHSDLIALAQTGTGKTAAYGLPLLQLLSAGENQDEGKHVRALILAPTRELCIQIAEDLQDFARYLPSMAMLAVYGGAGIEPQIRALRHGVDIVVATPGRLMDLMNRGVADLSRVRYVILDEADEMLSMGFQEDLNAILEGVPTDHRTLLFSATMSKEIERIAQRYLNDAHQIQVGSRNEGSENVNHIYYMVRAKDKYAALKRVVDYFPRIYAIIFCRTKAETQEVADNLIRDGYNADALHGDLSQQQRDLTMQKFRHHRTQLLVATDVAARGLDVDDLTHVINYGLPDDVESYTHRSGRTGRAGKKGTSISIVNMRERSRIRLVEKQIQKSFEQGTLPHPREICTKQLYHVIDDIERVEVDEEEIAPFMDEVQKRWEWLDKDDLIKRILSREFGRFLQYYANAPEIELVTEGRQGRESGEQHGRRRRGERIAEEGYTRLFINVGKIDGMFAREIIGMLNKHVHGDKVNVGRIDLMRNFSFVEVAEQDADRVIRALKHGVTVKGRSVVADRSESEPGESAERSDRKSAARGRRGREERPSRRKDRVREEAKPGRRKPSREERGYTEPRGKKYTKDDWMKFLHPEKVRPVASDGLVGEVPDFSEEGWARRRPARKDKGDK
ncbi:MAG: DEAD/DEAH box helicase [Bacteroidaceae bacterium]